MSDENGKGTENNADFLSGLVVKAPHAKAPQYVKARLSIKREELVASLQALEGDWINVEVKESRGGKWYAVIDHWKPEQAAPAAAGAR